VRDGRACWKVENENNNDLKTKGYHLEHNSGHGSKHLAALLLSLLVLLPAVPVAPLVPALSSEFAFAVSALLPAMRIPTAYVFYIMRTADRKTLHFHGRLE